MSSRAKIPKEIQREILIRSRRRCCLCYGLDGNFDERIGQIAHIDQNPSNNNIENLVWLCFDHHSLYDSTTSQHKNYQSDELKDYRNGLYRAISTSSLLGSESFGEYITTERSSNVITLPDRIIVIFDWPMRCAPTVEVSRDVGKQLTPLGAGAIKDITKRGFQILLNKPISISKFAFFADASPKEYWPEAELEHKEWEKSLGHE